MARRYTAAAYSRNLRAPFMKLHESQPRQLQILQFGRRDLTRAFVTT